MSARKIPIVSGEVYHIYNRSIARETIFRTKKEHERFLSLIRYYSRTKLPLRFSHYYRLPEEKKRQFEDVFIKKSEPLVEIYSFCIMPNHFHFLVKPLKEGGIATFIGNLQNAYSKFFNISSKRNGSLFQEMFKAVLVETDEQFIHVSRYIHLNPVTAHLIQPKDLLSYDWSSYRSFITNETDDLVNSNEVLNLFSSKTDYKSFVLDQVDYQRSLNLIKHLILE